jgi:hypothetical protein
MIKRWVLAAIATAFSAQAWAVTVTPTISIPNSCIQGGLSVSDSARLKAALIMEVSASICGRPLSPMTARFAPSHILARATRISGWLAVAAQKSATANSLSLDPTTGGGSSNGKLALSTANLYSAVQPAGACSACRRATLSPPRELMGTRSTSMAPVKALRLFPHQPMARSAIP